MSAAQKIYGWIFLLYNNYFTNNFIYFQRKVLCHHAKRGQYNTIKFL